MSVQLYPNLKGRNLTVRALDDRGVGNKSLENVRSFMNDPSVLGLVLGYDSRTSLQIASLIQGTDFGFYSPSSSLTAFRDSNQRNIINIGHTISDQLSTVIKYFTTVRRLQKMAIIYQDDLEGLEAFETIQVILNDLSLALVYSLQINSTGGMSRLQAQELLRSDPQAIFYWCDFESVISTILTVDNSSLSAANILTVTPYDYSREIHIAVNPLLPVTAIPPIYSVSYLPPVNFLTMELIKVYVEDVKGSNLSSAYDGALLYGYFLGTFLSQAIAEIQSINITRGELLDALYRYPVTSTLGVRAGPLSDVCKGPTATQPCCNQLFHSAFISATQFEGQGALSAVQTGSLLTWPDACQANISYLSLVNVGYLYDPTDPDYSDYYEGLQISQLYYNDLNIGKRNKQLRVVPIAANTSDPLDVIAKTALLVNTYKVIALIGYNAAATAVLYDRDPVTNAAGQIIPLIDPFTGARKFRDRYDFVFTRVNVRDQLISWINYLLILIEQDSPYINQEDGYLNMALYYGPDQEGLEALPELMNVTKTLESYYNYTGTNSTILRMQKMKMRFVLAISSDQRLANQTTSLISQCGYRIDWLLTSSREISSQQINLGLIKDIVRIQDENGFAPLSTPKARPNLRVLVVGSTRHVSTEHTIYNGTNLNDVWGCGYYPLGGIQTSNSFYPKPITLRDETLGLAIKYGYEFTEAGEGSYIAYSLLAQAIANINGVVSPQYILAAIYQGTVFEQAGVLMGPYVRTVEDNITIEYCSEGLHYASFITRNRSDIFLSLYNYQYDTCGATFDAFDPESIYISDSDSLDKIAIITGTVISGVALICIILSILVLLLVILMIKRKESGKVKLKEPKWIDYAVSKLFVHHRSQIETSYISVSPSQSELVLLARKKGSSPSPGLKKDKDVLKGLNQFISSPARAFFLLQALTKAGQSREDVASALVYIYVYNQKIDEFFNYGIKYEVGSAASEETLFREDSELATVWLVYSKLVGLPYLWSVLAMTLHSIEGVANQGLTRKQSVLFDVTSYEIDSHRIDPVSQQDQFVNLLHLKLAAQSMFNKIKKSHFPVELCRVLCLIKKQVHAKFPHVTKEVLANFVFLRFVCLAVTSPYSFGLVKKSPTSKNLRFLVLLSKVIQNLGFGLMFEKEGYMTEMNDFIKQNQSLMDTWLTEISGTIEDGEGKEEEWKAESYDKGFEVTLGMKMSCLKWLYALLYQNRQVLRRELGKRMDENGVADCEQLLEEIGVFKRGGSSSESLQTDGTDASRARGSYDEDEEEEDGELEEL